MSLSKGKTKIPFSSSFSSTSSFHANLLHDWRSFRVSPCEGVRTPKADFYGAVVVSRSTLRCDNCSFTLQRLIIDRRALTAQRGQWIRDWRNERLRWGHCTLTAQQLIQDRRALEAQLYEWIRDLRNEGLRSKHTLRIGGAGSSCLGGGARSMDSILAQRAIEIGTLPIDGATNGSGSSCLDGTARQFDSRLEQRAIDAGRCSLV